MTVTANPTTTSITTDEQRNILAEYANGRTVTELTAAGYTKKLATALVTDVAKFDRGRARQAVLEYDQAAAATRRPAAPARPADPAGDRDEQIDTVVDLLDVAERTGVARIVKAAGRIRAQIADLQAAVDDVAKEQQLRQAADEARAAYELAQAELRQLTGRAPGAALVGRSDKERNRRIREWAASTGRDVGVRGVIPAEVVAAYEAARSDA